MKNKSNYAVPPEVTSAAGHCQASSPGPCISVYGQVIKWFDVSSILVMYLSIKAMYKYMA